MRILFILLLFGTCCSAQLRNNQPLPVFSKKAHSVLKKQVKGWSYSLDGQWISGKKTIPIRTVSRNTEAYKSRPGYLGLDNFEEFRLYPVLYDKDTLLLIVKIYNNGRFKYSRSKKGWRENTNAFYYLFDKSELQKLDNLQDSVVQLVNIRLLDDGKVKDIRKSKVLDEIKERVKVNKDYDRNLIVQLQPFADLEKIRFQLYSIHTIFKDADGILSDFTLNGQSLYGQKELFNYLYYETDIDNFSRFFILPASFDFKL